MESTKQIEERKKFSYKSKVISSQRIKVNNNQNGNPLLKYNRFQYDFYKDLVEDYEIGGKVSVLYLQIKYHIEYPKYLEGRAKALVSKKRDKLNILLLQVDQEDATDYITQIQLDWMQWGIKVFLAWSSEEWAKYIQIFKAYENKGTNILEENKKNKSYNDLAIDALTNIKSINKKDAKKLLENYGSIADIINADYDDFINLEGIGPTKVEALKQCFSGKINPL